MEVDISGWGALIGATPIRGIITFGNGLMERRPWPIANALNITVFDRVEMNVMIMIFKIGRVADEMFPESSLPDAPTAIFPVIFPNGRFMAAGGKPKSRKIGLDAAHSGGEIMIIRRHRPDHVEVVGQEDQGRYLKRF